MAVVKLSKSKNQIQFIDEDGNMFCTSRTFMESLLRGTIRSDFVLLTRMPLKVSQDRFKQSPVYDPEGNYTYAKRDSGALKVEQDGLSGATIKKNEQKRQFTDKNVW